MLGRIATFMYGVFSYAVSLACFAYLAGFMVNVGVPKAMDSHARVPLGTALLIDLGLLLLFALQHSVMARPGFKRAWTRVVPEAAERSTYLLFSCAALFVLFWKWEPLSGTLWDAGDGPGKAIAYFFYALGWVIVLASTFLINHFDLFGLRQVWLRLRNKEYTSLRFGTPGFYRFVRHPLYVGWFLVFWAAPVMSSAHLVFAIATTLYILVAIRFEERDLVSIHPEYAEYRKHVPMFMPTGRSASDSGSKGRAGMEVA